MGTARWKVRATVISALVLGVVILPRPASAQSGYWGGEGHPSGGGIGRNNNNMWWGIGEGLLRGLSDLERDNRHRNYSRRNDYDDHNRYRQYNRPPQYSRPPQYTRPAPKPAPPKNVVKTRKKPAINKVNFSFLSARASAETDARQSVEAEKSKAMLDVEITEQITNTGNKKMLDAWNEVVKNGSTTSDVSQFTKTFGGAMSSGLKDTMDLRQGFSAFSDALQAGTLTFQEKEIVLQALADKTQSLGSRPGQSSTFWGTIDANISNMGDFNKLGQIADLSQNSRNPFSPLMQGIYQLGMPTMFASELTGLPVIPIDPINEFTGNAASIIIYNPSSTGESVNYLLAGNKYSMEPGFQQTLAKSYTISFETGASGGKKQYTLADGVYEWRMDATKGWDLFVVPVNVTIDNSRYEGEFKYLLDNKPYTLGLGEVVEHTSKKPIEIAFDPGKGGKERRKLLRSSTNVVGIDPEHGHLDLFDSKKVDEHMAGQPEYLSSTRLAGNNASRSQRVQALLSQMKGAGQQDPLALLGVSGRLSSRVGSGIFPLGGGNRTGVSALPPQGKKSVTDLLKSLDIRE